MKDEKENTEQAPEAAYKPDIYYTIESTRSYKDAAEDVLREKFAELTFESVLEIGPGDGHLIRDTKAPIRVAIEISTEMVNAFSADGVTLITGDINDSNDFMEITNISESFDLILAHFVFMEMKSPEIQKCMQHIAKLLSAGGTFLFTITNPDAVLANQFEGANFVFPEGKDIDKPYTVMVENDEGELVDVGIRDYFNLLSVYVEAIHDAGLQFTAKYIRKESEISDFGVIFTVTK